MLQPPLPEEDYPDDSQDGWGPLVFPEDFHPTIPRAAVDFNTLSGWRHLSDPYGKTALTGEAKPEQVPNATAPGGCHGCDSRMTFLTLRLINFPPKPRYCIMSFSIHSWQYSSLQSSVKLHSSVSVT